MAFKDFPEPLHGVRLLQRSLERGRLAHAYLFAGDQLDTLEAAALTLAKTLNCLQPRLSAKVAVDCCDECLSCRRIEHGNHPDVHWVRPESKLRVITVDQMRELMREIQLKPTEAHYKVVVIVGADRLKTEAANAFLKTLEEPPPGSILTLLSTEPQRLLETILSRCLQLNFAAEGLRPLAPDRVAWLTAFSELAATEQKSLLGRYRLLDVLLGKLNEIKEIIGKSLAARSPLERYPEAEKDLRDQWEEELAAAVEAEYRRQRTDLLVALEWWLRDVWLHTLSARAPGPESTAQSPNPLRQGASTAPLGELRRFPELTGAGRVAQRVSSREALENLQVIEQLQRWLSTNMQEALALEVGLLKLRL